MAYNSFVPDPDIYDPDDEETWGYGDFIDEDGAKKFGHDPAEASRLREMQPAAPEPVAPENDPARREYEQWTRESGQQMPTPAPVAPPVPMAPPTRQEIQQDSATVEDPSEWRAAVASGAGGLDPSKLARIITYETAGTNDPSIVSENSPSHAGLIQFGKDIWPGVARAAGTPDVSWDDMRKMTVAEQMPYVTTYLKQRGVNENSSLGDYYMAVAAPSLRNASDETVAYKRGSIQVKKNAPWDRNKDGEITVGELRTVLGDEGPRPTGQTQSFSQFGRPSTGVIPQVPGLDVAQVTTQGTALTPDQIRERQQRTMDSANVQAAFVQNAAQQRIAGRTEAMTEVEAERKRFEQDNTYRQMHDAAVRNVAAQKINEVFREPVSKVDPLRLIKNMDAGDVVLGAIALIVGGIGQGLQVTGGATGAQNQALEMLNSALRADVDAQKDALDRGERDKNNRVAHWTLVLNNAESGLDAAIAESKIATAKRIETVARNSIESADIQAQAMQASQQLMAEGQALAQGIEDRENQRMTVVYQPPKPAPVLPPPVVGTELAPVGTEDRDPATRAALAAQFDTRNPAHVQQLKQMGTGMSLVGQMERDLKTLEQAYGVTADENGRYPTDGNYVSSATGWDPFDAFDEISDPQAAQKARLLKQAWSAVELNTRMGWKSEPNNKVKQDEYAGVDQPTLDEDVPKKLEQLRQEIEARRTEVQSSTQAPVRAAWKLQNQFPIAGGVTVRPVTGPTNRGR